MTRTQLMFRPAGPEDEQLLTDLLAGLSPASAFHRFMAGLGHPKPSLVRALLRTDERRGAWLAVERDAAGGERAVGHAIWSLVPGSAGADMADLGVVVADEAQGRGIGSALFEAAARSAADAGAVGVHLDVHPDNRRVARILRAKLGKSALAWDQGLLTLDAPLLAAVRGPVGALAA